jgi:uncharacterized protein YfkK (UPF0435 family)
MKAKFEEINNKLNKVTEILYASPVIYDETEYFDQSTLSYPFIKRKTNLPISRMGSNKVES